MNLERIKDSVVRALYHSAKTNVIAVTSNSPDMAIKGMAELNNFIYYLDKKVGKIYEYANSESKTKPLILRAKTKNFTFEYSITPNKKSNLSVTMHVSYDRDFDEAYLLTKCKSVYGYVYFVNSIHGVKIGCTGKLTKRLRTFDVKLPFKVELHSFIKCKDHNKIESFLHKLLEHKRIDGEWFDIKEEDYKDIDKVLLNMKLQREVAFHG